MVSGYRLSLPNRDLHRSQPDIGAHGSVATSLERSSRSLRAKPCSIDVPFRSSGNFGSRGCNIGPSVCSTLYGRYSKISVAAFATEKIKWIVRLPLPPCILEQLCGLRFV